MTKNILKSTTLFILLGLTMLSNKAMAVEPYMLEAKGVNAVIRYSHPFQTILPNKPLSFTAEYTGSFDTTGMDWWGTICGGEFKVYRDVGRVLTINDVMMPKVGKTCFINLTALHITYENEPQWAGSVGHNLVFVNPTLTFGYNNNPNYGQDQYFVQSTLPQGHIYSYWDMYIRGCTVQSTGGAGNKNTMKLNHRTNGKVCTVNVHALAKYDGNSLNNWANNKFVIYKKTTKFNPLNQVSSQMEGDLLPE